MIGSVEAHDRAQLLEAVAGVEDPLRRRADTTERLEDVGAGESSTVGEDGRHIGVAGHDPGAQGGTAEDGPLLPGLGQSGMGIVPPRRCRRIVFVEVDRHGRILRQPRPQLR